MNATILYVKVVRFILLVAALALFSLLGGLTTLPKWAFFPIVGIYFCGFFGGMASAIEARAKEIND